MSFQQTLKCDKIDDWPITEVGNIASISCDDNKKGTMERLCANINNVPIWKEISRVGCRIINIFVDDPYPIEFYYDSITGYLNVPLYAKPTISPLGYNYKYEIISLPNGLSINEYGEIIGTPTKIEYGYYVIKVIGEIDINVRVSINIIGIFYYFYRIE